MPPPCLPSLAAALLALATAAVPAASLTVVVTTVDGRPAADVVVQVTPSGPGAAAAPAARASDPVVITQKDIRFVPRVTAVPVGATVRFTNQDRFDHHIRSQPGGPLGNQPPAQQFELRLPGAKPDRIASADLRLEAAGTVVLGCHLHSSMRGHLFVSATPYVAVTDANGRAAIEGLPDGPATLRGWHPEQLVDQADQALSLAPRGPAGLVTYALNFTPRARPGRAAP